jgi:hypothetical protein
MPGIPILTQLEQNIAQCITTMQPGSYHYRWSTVNEPDLAKCAFPCAAIYMDSDTSLDDPNGPDSGMYMHETIYRIEVLARLESEVANPRWAINVELNKAFDDLLKLFGRNWNLMSTTDTFMYVSSRREYLRTNDIFIPSKLVTYWRARWEADRSYPDQVA